MLLRKTQDQFTKALNPHCSTKTLQSFCAGVTAESAEQAEAKVNIYRHSISQAHVDTLLSIFPVCSQIVGEQFFSQWSKEYLWKNPSHHQDLNQYGETFPEFIGEQLDSASFENDFQYLPDLARLEYNWNQVIFKAEDTEFNFDLFSDISAEVENYSFQLNSTLVLMQSDHPIQEIFFNHKENRNCDSISALDKKELLCLYRPELTPEIKIISEQEFDLLTACENEKTLNELGNEDLALDLTLLPQLITEKKVTGFYLRKESNRSIHV